MYDTTDPKQTERSEKVTVALDKKRFGPWALVTGASSGIGKEFARQIAASGINVVLVARRESLLDEVAQGLAKDFKVQYRNVVADLSQEGFLDDLAGQYDGASGHRPPFRRETHRATPGRNHPRGGNGCGKRRSPYGE